MKRFAVISLFILACLSVVFVAIYRENQKNDLKADLAVNCEVKPATSFEAQRSLGIILRDNSVLAVKSASELDFAPPGGGIDISNNFQSEDARTALAREISEELGVEVDAGRDLNEYKTYCEVLDDAGARRTYLYFVESWNGVFTPPEGTELKWVDFTYAESRQSDSELTKSLEFLKQDRFIK